MKHLFFLVGLLCLTAAPISSFAQAQNAKDLTHIAAAFGEKLKDS